MAKKEIKNNKEQIQERLETAKAKLGTFFYKPFRWQKKALEVVRNNNTTGVIASNKTGKTGLGANVAISWALGYEPWQYVEKGDPDAIEVGGQFYRKSSLGIKPPVNIIITGEDWKMHLGRTLIPELKKWAPVGWYETRKNEQGVEYLWEWVNGSVFTVMCYTQEDDLFESFRAQGVWMDEPPPKSKYDAMSRGLLLDCGKTLMTLTPLKEAWILDEIVLSGRKDIGIVDNLVITENENLTTDDKTQLKKLGLTNEQIGEFFDKLLYSDVSKAIPVTDRGNGAEKYLEGVISQDRIKDINNLKILKFIKDIHPSEVPPRVFGQFKSLIGRVLKEFDDKIHVIEPFKLPSDYIVVPMIDFHLSKPQAISYWAVNRNNINYCVDEVWENISADEIADDIIIRKNNGWKIQDVFIDPLSKGDTMYMKNMVGSNIRDSFSIIYDKLSQNGITLHVASKDKDSGIMNIQTMLKGVNGLATCYIFDTCERHIYEVKRWIFDDDGKPAKDCDDHFMENWYRFTLTGITYDAYKINPLPIKQEFYQYREAGWMRA